MKRYGLLGFPLKHSFSKKYFTEKFQELGIEKDHEYDLYELPEIDKLLELVQKTDGITGFNVTIPHKQAVIPFLDEIDEAAIKIGAVNVIKVLPTKKLKGYNSDYYGFRNSLIDFLGENKVKALVLGNGGAAKAIIAALEDLNIAFKIVSRKSSTETISYTEANTLIEAHKLIINCSPLGTFPNVEDCPAIDYTQITSGHFLYDLVYNPEVTLFMQKGKDQGAQVKNGYEMLVLQAEKSWEIWEG